MNFKEFFKQKKAKNKPKNTNNKKKLLKIFFIFIFLLIIAIILLGTFLAWKAETTLNRISTNANALGSIAKLLPWSDSKINGETDGRINILLLGSMNPEKGALSDSQMVVSLNPKENKLSMISIPRDLAVENPTKIDKAIADQYSIPISGNKSKLNAVYSFAYLKDSNQALNISEKAYSNITGIPINYAIVISQNGFHDFISAIGGVDIELSKPFDESAQFNQPPQICDDFFTQATGEFQLKKKKIKDPLTGKVIRIKITKKYPLCTAPPSSEECNGDFKLPAGKQTLSADQTLCFVRSRHTTNDFERAKRQQMVLQSIKNKLFSVGTLTNPIEIISLIKSVGDNVKTDMQAWEMLRLYEIFINLSKDKAPIIQHTIEASYDGADNGLLYNKRDPELGAVLLPKNDNFDEIHKLFQCVFNSTSQKDAAPKI